MSSGIVGTKLTIKKHKKTILGPLDFHIQPGRLVGVIGPSGAGKSTLMRTIVGLQMVSTGELTIDNVSAGHRLLRRKIGYAPQGTALYSDISVRENLEYFGALYQVDIHEIESIISQVDLDEQIDQQVATLSGGQRARVSLAIALLGSPDMLILDEPTVGLDPLIRERLWSLFADLANTGKTILISSHVMDEAERCDDLLLIRDGLLLWNGSRSGLLKKSGTKTVEAAFLKMVEE